MPYQDKKRKVTNMKGRKVKISWKDLEASLKKNGTIFEEEEVREITLAKPKEILIYLEKEAHDN